MIIYAVIASASDQPHYYYHVDSVHLTLAEAKAAIQSEIERSDLPYPTLKFVGWAVARDDYETEVALFEEVPIGSPKQDADWRYSLSIREFHIKDGGTHDL